MKLSLRRTTTPSPSQSAPRSSVASAQQQLNQRNLLRPETKQQNKHQQQRQQQQSPTLANSSQTQLSSRVKSISARLLECHGAELRRVLFSLRQSFQEEPELASQFANSQGLDTLMRIASSADQIHQNYILRVLGQLLQWSDCAKALLCHKRTVRWLYALLVAQPRVLVRSALKLLLQLILLDPVQAGETVCCAIREHEQSRTGAKLWSSLIELLTRICNSHRDSQIALFLQNQQASSTSNNNKDSNLHQDVSILIDAMTLINKTLSSIPFKETYYDFCDPLDDDEQGEIIESVGTRFSALDPQLQAQFDLYKSEQLSRRQTTKSGASESVDHLHEIKPVSASNCNVSASSSGELIHNEQQLNVTPASNKQITKSNFEGHKHSEQASSASNNLISINDNIHSNDAKLDEAEEDFSSSRSSINEMLEKDHQQQRKQTQASPKLMTKNSHMTLATRPRNSTPRMSTSTTATTAPNDADSYESANDDFAPDYERQVETRSHPCGGYGGTDKTPTRAKLSSSTSLPTNVSTSSSNGSTPTGKPLASSQPQQIRRTCKPSVIPLNLNNHHGPSQATSMSVETISDGGASAAVKLPTKDQNPVLARGKQQRASISSCSSSDSYASYGSGYASGSGNSTDHEQKQTRLQLKLGRSDARTSSSSVPPTSSPKNVDEGHIDESQDETIAQTKLSERELREKEEEDAKRASQLKKHLSELEQLTDQLASRNLLKFGDSADEQANSGRSSRTSSKPSSLISTDGLASSNLSSLTSNSGATAARPQTQDIKSQLESRSSSATPTSLIAARRVLVSSTSLTNSKQIDQTNTRISSTSPAQQQQREKPAPVTAAAAPPAPAIGQVSQQSQQAKPSIDQSNSLASSQSKQPEPYYHNLFHWEQLVSKGVTRPLLINDLDFTDLRDEDDCDLLNSVNSSKSRGNHAPGEPLSISIPNGNQAEDLVDSGCGSGSPKAANGNVKVAAGSAPPPPMPPPPISPWFNTISLSRPQSQLLLNSPTPSAYEQGGNNSSNLPHNLREQQAASPVDSTYSNYSRNSVFLPQTSTPTREHLADQYGNQMQGVSSLRSASSMSSLLFGNGPNGGKYGQLNKRKKTMKLFWKEVREDRSLLAKLTKKKTIWDEIKPAQVDTQKLEYLFESKAKDLSLSRSRNGLDGIAQRKVKITVLDAKRSNAINIGMTKLPPIRTIKSAILKMDSSIMNREGIEKILTTMMPTEEEKSRIIEAQLANPETPLGTAEQFLLNLASISALEARLKLWAFQLDYAQIEKEVAEPLMDLKQAIEEIESSETFRMILGTLLSIGNFLNSTNVKGFQIDYLEKVPEVKDTVHKHSLLHHLCMFIHENYDPNLTRDLYSEFGAVNRASKIDYIEVGKNLKKMQQDCRASWDYLKIVAKHDGLANLINTSSVSTSSSSSSSNSSNTSSGNLTNSPNASNNSTSNHHQAGKLNNLSKLSMITTITGTESQASTKEQALQQVSGGGSSTSGASSNGSSGSTAGGGKQLKMRVSDFLTDCAERIMVLMVIHRRVMNRFQKLLVYLGCPSQLIKQTQPQQILKIVNEFALEYRTKRERVREMLLKRQQQQQQLHNHHNHHPQCQHYHQNRWQLNRSRWAGSQQFINSPLVNSDSFNQQQATQRPLSTASSYANGPPDGPSQHHNQQQHQLNGRPSSPSGFSQISGYSDFIFDQAPPMCCQSRQQSVTPVPSELSLSNGGRNPMSMSMLDLQQSRVHGGQTSAASQEAKQKEDQLCRLLGAGKSFDEACSDLLKMSHWTSMGGHHRAHRQLSKQRHASVDCSPGAVANQTNKQQQQTTDYSQNGDSSVSSVDSRSRRQSSYYRHLNSSQSFEDEPNSDEEIMQCLVRTAVGSSGGGTRLSGAHNNSSQNSSTCSSNQFRTRA